jgi:DNA-binding MarR family transcriptional regulator
MSSALERVPEISGTILDLLAIRSADMTANQIAREIGEDPYLTSVACRRLREAGAVSWDRVPGSRQWSVHLLEHQAVVPQVSFAAFAREMGFQPWEVSTLSTGATA